MALNRTRRCGKFNLKFLYSILAGIIGVFYVQTGAHKSAKSKFCIIRFCPTTSMSYRNVFLNKKCQKPVVAICFRFREKSLVYLDYRMKFIKRALGEF